MITPIEYKNGKEKRSHIEHFNFNNALQKLPEIFRNRNWNKLNKIYISDILAVIEVAFGNRKLQSPLCFIIVE